MSEVGDKIVLIPGCHCCSSHLSIYHCPRLDLKDRTVEIREKKKHKKVTLNPVVFQLGAVLSLRDVWSYF